MKPGVDYIAVGVVYYCTDGNGKVVMNLRGAKCKDENGRWDIGGGTVEFGETLEETLVREIKEEYCAEIQEKEFLGFREVLIDEQDRKRHWIAFDFKVRLDPSQVKNGEPHKFDDVAWFTKDALPSPLHSQMPIFFEKYAAKL